MANKTVVNLLSNFLSRFWSIGVGIIFVPLYIKIIGIESYGLVGFYTTLATSLGILDLGLNGTLSRELTRDIALKVDAYKTRNLVFSVEILFWIEGLLLGSLIVLFSNYIGLHWIKYEALRPRDIIICIEIMGGMIALEWPKSLYIGGLVGLHEIPKYNVVSIIFNTLKGAGVIPVLLYVSSSIEAFFAWQFFVSLGMVCTLRIALWRKLPKANTLPEFSIQELRRIWRFALGMMGISLGSFALTQFDKIILSHIIALNQYGQYMLAWTLGTSTLFIAGILFIVLQPKLTETVAIHDENIVRLKYHQIFRLVATLVFPIGIILCFKSREILLIWTQNSALTADVYKPVIILSAGTICYVFMQVPLILMLAYGWTRFSNMQNLIASFVLIVLLLWWVHIFGITGAALVWLVLNLGFLFISLPLIHRKLLKGEVFNIYFKDIGIPLVITLCINILCKYIFPLNEGRYIEALFIIVTLSINYVLLIISSREYKVLLYEFYLQYISPIMKRDY